ncbi:MAG TPA: hypothetical protein VIT62_10985 [Lysobacter sp.]
MQMSALPIDAADRKAAPVFSGLLAYFPKTAVAIARLSLAGNIQHYGPGKPLHWNREVSADHQDCMLRHTMQSGTYDTDGILHDVKAAWRALAQCEVTIDRLAGLESEAREPTEAEKAAYADPVAFITAHVPPFVARDSDEPMGLSAGEAISAGGTD